MESKERTPSVIARLMGLDEYPPQQSTTTQRRVFSDRYLQKVASLGVRERRLSNVHGSFMMGIGEEQEIKEAIESLEALKKYMDHNQLVGKKEANPAFMRSRIAFTKDKLLDCKQFSKNSQLRASKGYHDSLELENSKDISVRYSQKPKLLDTKSFNKLQGVLPSSVLGNKRNLNTSCALDNGTINRFRRSRKTTHSVELPSELENDEYVSKSGRELCHKLPSSCLDLKDDACVTSTVKPKAENPVTYTRSSASSVNVHSADMKPEEIHNFGSRSLFVSIEERRKLAEDIVPVGQRSKSSTETTKEIMETARLKNVDSSVKESQPVMLPTFSNSEKGYKSLSPCPDGLLVAREAKKRISERWNTSRKFQVGVTRNSKTLNEVLAIPAHVIKPRKLDFNLNNRHLSNQSCCNDGDVNIPIHLSITSMGDILPADDDDNSSQVQDSLFQQEDISDGIPEEGSVSSQSSGTDRRSFTSSEEVYQRSPDSVLEMSPSTGCFERVKADLYGLKMQLELLESDSSEEYSEPGIVVSSEEGSVGCNEESQGLMRSVNVEESRDYSYLVDVLTEAGDLNMSFNTWHSPECPISPSVFETLETKYGKQMTWTSSRRKLLFDRMNSGLKEIFGPRMGTPTWTTPVTDRFSWGTIEEKLWKLLVHQEKEASASSYKRALTGYEGLVEDKQSKMLVIQEKEEKRGSYEKVLRGDAWLSDLGDDVEGIAKEMESLLVDEVVAEVVVSMLSF